MQAAAITLGLSFVIIVLHSVKELCVTYKLSQINPMSVHLFPFLVSQKNLREQVLEEKKPQTLQQTPPTNITSLIHP